MSNPLCYEIMTPESVGAPTSELVLGKHSGRHALALRCVELGYSLNDEELQLVYRAFTELADRKKRIYDQDLISLVAGVSVPIAPPPVEDRQWAAGARA
jgi:2-isopropylmalate synthase